MIITRRQVKLAKNLQSLSLRVPKWKVRLFEKQNDNFRASRHQFINWAPFREICFAKCHAFSFMNLLRRILIDAAVIVRRSATGSGYFRVRMRACIVEIDKNCGYVEAKELSRSTEYWGGLAARREMSGQESIDR